MRLVLPRSVVSSRHVCVAMTTALGSPGNQITCQVVVDMSPHPHDDITTFTWTLHSDRGDNYLELSLRGDNHLELAH